MGKTAIWTIFSSSHFPILTMLRNYAMVLQYCLREGGGGGRRDGAAGGEELKTFLKFP